MSISVIIPSLNEEQHIERAIRSAQRFANQVIVVDANSRDNTQHITRETGAELLICEQGRGQQLRHGAMQASGQVLLFLHADSWLDDGAGSEIRALLDPEKADEPIFGCFRQRIDDPRRRFRILEAGNAFRARQFGMPYGDQAVFLDRRSYDRVGGFANVPLMEDVILSQRLRRIKRPTVLNGPVHLSARRWQADGVLRRTLINWSIYSAFRLGISPQRLAHWYR